MGVSLSSMLKDGVKKFMASLGYAIVRKDASAHSMDDAFRAILRRRHAFNTVIDVGASNGSWTLSLIKYFPKCQYLLIEAQPTHKHALEQLNSERKNVNFVLAAAGEAAGHIYFDGAAPLGGLASYTPTSSNDIQVPVTTIDHEIQSRNLPGPYLLKFDTHGFEIPILKGASKTLAETDVIIMECYNFKIAPECLLFFEMCDHMKNLGFRCIDLVEPFNRPHDDSFWQMDLVFVKDDRPEFSYVAYE